MSQPLLMDVDTGVDDAMALALTAGLTDVELVGVTTVAGNVSIDLATANTLKVLDWIGCDAPVYRGMSQPLVRPLHTATSVHGDDGLGGWQDARLGRYVEDVSAPEAIIRLVREHKGEIVGAFVGPLTNLAVALALEPRISEWFKQVTIMGGAFFERGNVTPAAEFNIFVDPEAAAIVARSSLPTVWIGLDVTHQVSVSHAFWRTLESADTAAAVLVREVCRFTFDVRQRDAVHLHDPLAVATIANPDLVTLRRGQVRVDVGEFARGETRLVEGDGTAQVACGVESGRFVDVFGAALGL